MAASPCSRARAGPQRVRAVKVLQQKLNLKDKVNALLTAGPIEPAVVHLDLDDWAWSCARQDRPSAVRFLDDNNNYRAPKDWMLTKALAAGCLTPGQTCRQENCYLRRDREVLPPLIMIESQQMLLEDTSSTGPASLSHRRQADIPHQTDTGGSAACTLPRRCIFDGRMRAYVVLPRVAVPDDAIAPGARNHLAHGKVPCRTRANDDYRVLLRTGRSAIEEETRNFAAANLQLRRGRLSTSLSSTASAPATPNKNLKRMERKRAAVPVLAQATTPPMTFWKR